MKVKKDDSKNKKKKDKIQQVTSSGIKKSRKPKKIKVEENTEVGEAIKKELTESQATVVKRSPLRQERWNAYLKVFLEHEKLNKKQKLIMEFCTNKGLTPPRRKKKFLNFIRNCYNHQTDVTDEQVYELFDIVLQKYSDFKSGNYHDSDPKSSTSEATKTPKLKVNKMKKLKRAASSKTNSLPVKEEIDEEKFTKVKSKKKKRSKDATVKVENNVKMETDD